MKYYGNHNIILLIFSTILICTIQKIWLYYKWSGNIRKSQGFFQKALGWFGIPH